MIDPNSIMHIENTEIRTQANQLQVLKFDDIPEYDTETYDIYSDKDFKKYILQKLCHGKHQEKGKCSF